MLPIWWVTSGPEKRVISESSTIMSTNTLEILQINRVGEHRLVDTTKKHSYLLGNVLLFKCFSSMHYCPHSFCFSVIDFWRCHFHLHHCQPVWPLIGYHVWPSRQIPMCILWTVYNYQNMHKICNSLLPEEKLRKKQKQISKNNFGKKRSIKIFSNQVLLWLSIFWLVFTLWTVYRWEHMFSMMCYNMYFTP